MPVLAVGRALRDLPSDFGSHRSYQLYSGIETATYSHLSSW